MKKGTEIKLKILSSKQISKKMEGVMHLFYWAGWIGDSQLVWKFIYFIGISPFIKMVKDRNLVTACV